MPQLRSSFLLVLSVLLFLVPTLNATTVPGDFTVVVLPDTQYYAASYPQIFNAQTQWIAANRDALNIQLVIGVGDIVDGPMQVTQWQNADAAVRLLDGVVPYVLAIGNHDYDNLNPGARQAANFNQWFGPARYAGYSWYGGNLNGSNENFYATVNMAGASYLVLALEYIPRRSSLDWATSVLQANADKPVILVTHSYMYRDNTTVDQCDTADNTASSKTTGYDGLNLWRSFVSQYPNIKMVLSGHILGVGNRSDLGVNGNLVNQMLVDYQGWANGGNGYLRTMTFRPLQNTVEIQTYSPYLKRYLTDAANHFTWTLSPTVMTAATGTVQGRVRRGRIGAPNDCGLLPGANIASTTSSATADETATYEVESLSGEQQMTASDEGFLTNTDNIIVNPGSTTDVPIFLFPDQNFDPLCDVSAAADHSVTFCSAGSSSDASQVEVKAQAKLAQGFVNLMQLYVDGVSKGQSNTNQLDVPLSLPPGTHRLVVKARDSSGLYFSGMQYVSMLSPSVCDVSGAPNPSVIICSPRPNAITTSPVQITAESNDFQPITRMQLYVDGVMKYTVNARQMSTSYALTPGSHRLTVTSTDAAKVTAKSTVNVTVP